MYAGAHDPCKPCNTFVWWCLSAGQVLSPGAEGSRRGRPAASPVLTRQPFCHVQK